MEREREREIERDTAIERERERERERKRQRKGEGRERERAGQRETETNADSLRSPPALATVPTVSAEKLPLLGASAACGAARSTGALGAAPGTKSGLAT